MWRIFVCLMFVFTSTAIAAEPLQFGVLNQRSVLLTAQLWNPILAYLTEKTGVPLVLKMGKTAQETTMMTVRGDFDFVYTNHLFTPERDKLGYRPIARWDGAAISGLLVVLASSPYRQLSDLQGRTVGFPATDSFASYAVNMAKLQASKVSVATMFVGNQEAVLSNLQHETIAAAGVNNVVLESYIQREPLAYRVLYQSPSYFDMPIMVNPRVPVATVEKVQAALIGMNQDVVGRAILLSASALLKRDKALNFVSANQQDYDNYRVFYQHQQVRTR
ncbi:MAG: phosphate/phosphite/phosphonate ABC transporter substrate-binding protein [Sulfuriferula sp.]|nr:phosphate/phosphite/phosphonate ABC transporter substrate-binding protein [Sulfuriferula sp.]